MKKFVEVSFPLESNPSKSLTFKKLMDCDILPLNTLFRTNTKNYHLGSVDRFEYDDRKNEFTMIVLVKDHISNEYINELKKEMDKKGWDWYV